MKIHRAGLSAIALLVLSWACGSEEPEAPLGSVRAAIKQRQGPTLTGERLVEHWIRIGSSGSVSVTGANVHISRRGEDWQGTRLAGQRLLGADATSASETLTFELRGVYPHASGAPPVVQPDEFEYDVVVRSGLSTFNLCSDDPASNRAIPYYQGGDRFAFVCLDSARAKCFDLGYKPWVARAAGTALACEAALRADYCGNRQSGTVSGTLIEIYDRLSPPISARTPGSPMQLEGVWESDGTALCLSRRRWQTLPIKGQCPVVLPDPRLGPPLGYCDSRTLDEWAALGGRIFVDSPSVIDVGLYSWRARTGGRVLTTSAYAYQSGVEPPAMDRAGAHDLRRFEGSLFSRDSDPVLRVGTVPLYRYYDAATGASYTTTGRGPAGFARDPLPEGYIYDPARAQTQGTLALYSWKSPGDLYDTTTNPQGRPTDARLEGYVIDPGGAQADHDSRDHDGDGVPGYKWNGTRDPDEDFDDEVYDQRSFCRQASGRVLVGDFNGDGRDDLLCHDTASGYLSIDHGAGAGTTHEPATPFCAGRRLRVGDFNGDGRADLLCQEPATGAHWVWYAGEGGVFTGLPVLQGASGCVAAEEDVFIGDFNGDRRADVLCHNQAGGQKWIAYAGAGGLSGYVFQLTWCHAATQLFVGDFNGDGRSDLLCHQPADGYKWIALADGSGRFGGTSWQAALGWCSHDTAELHVGDFSGDGRADLLCHDTRSGYKWLALANAAGQFTGTTWEGDLRFCKGGPDILRIHNAGRLLVGRMNFGRELDLACHYEQGLGGLRVRYARRNPEVGFLDLDIR